MRILMIGHGDARQNVRALMGKLREKGHVVSCYFDADLDVMNRNRGLPPTDFLVVGLSSESRNPNSTEAIVEKDILGRAADNRIASCVMCDSQGHVSAPYLAQVGSHVKIVVLREPDPHGHVLSLCENAAILFLNDILRRPDGLLDVMRARTMAPARSSA